MRHLVTWLLFVTGGEFKLFVTSAVTVSFYHRRWDEATCSESVGVNPRWIDTYTRHQRVLNDLQRARLFRGRKIWFFAHPLLHLSRQKTRPATHRKTEKERHLADGRGGGWARSRIILQQECLVLYKSFNTLCTTPWYIHNIIKHDPQLRT